MPPDPADGAVSMKYLAHGGEVRIVVACVAGKESPDLVCVHLDFPCPDQSYGTARALGLMVAVAALVAAVEGGETRLIL